MARSRRRSFLISSAALALLAAPAFAAPPGVRPPLAFHARPPVPFTPYGYMTYRHGGVPWYYGHGYWYRPWHGRYYNYYPPIGLSISLLPDGYSTYWFGGIPYFYFGGVYYTESPYGGYSVANPPSSQDQSPQPLPGPDPELDSLLITPKQGQNEDKMRADRVDAQRYARDRSGYDPAYSDPSDPGTPRARQAYLRAMKGFLEQRGYSVN